MNLKNKNLIKINNQEQCTRLFFAGNTGSTQKKLADIMIHKNNKNIRQEETQWFPLQ